MFGRFNREAREGHFGHEGRDRHSHEGRERHMHDGFGHGWRFGRHGRGGGVEPREGRMFEGGDLKLVILAMVAEKPSYGYELIKALGERVGGGYSPSPGVIYPTLTLIEEMGYATASQEPGGRKLFTVTAEGQAFLAANQAQVDAIFARLDGAETLRRGDLAPLMRAMQNLRMAVMLRARHRAATPEAIQAIADTLDAAAKTIERL
jgi:DNA-binding PadR family transcriptional regulator